MQSKFTILMSLLCVFAAAFTISSGEASASESKTLTVAYANEEPYGFINSDGLVTGEAPEIMKVVAERLGYDEVEFGKRNGLA